MCNVFVVPDEQQNRYSSHVLLVEEVVHNLKPLESLKLRFLHRHEVLDFMVCQTQALFFWACNINIL